jgi:hypothetical protein
MNDGARDEMKAELSLSVFPCLAAPINLNEEPHQPHGQNSKLQHTGVEKVMMQKTFRKWPQL